MSNYTKTITHKIFSYIRKKNLTQNTKNFSIPFICLLLYSVYHTSTFASESSNFTKQLQNDLNHRASATAVLQTHCPTPISAQLLDTHAPPSLQKEAEYFLHLPSTRLKTRHIQLLCGNSIRSEAWNIYAPERLTIQARTLLSNSHTPFGKVIGETFFQRETLQSNTQYLPKGFILENKALLKRTTDQKAFSLLIERYTPVAHPSSLYLGRPIKVLPSVRR